jgi:hypothetical protein
MRSALGRSTASIVKQIRPYVLRQTSLPQSLSRTVPLQHNAHLSGYLVMTKHAATLASTGPPFESSESTYRWLNDEPTSMLVFPRVLNSP